MELPGTLGNQRKMAELRGFLLQHEGAAREWAWCREVIGFAGESLDARQGFEP
ncbi:hypothetical protein [Sphingobium fuliginis]|uniref:hypothetical protein n=1 Tax=Sphingobium fuliginis (strain ATCC 27551) TaxID=336203 RepID=UPI001C3FB35F|nr:hypothetical protein [Sphingobium fuliginis]